MPRKRSARTMQPSGAFRTFCIVARIWTFKPGGLEPCMKSSRFGRGCNNKLIQMSLRPGAALFFTCSAASHEAELLVARCPTLKTLRWILSELSTSTDANVSNSRQKPEGSAPSRTRDQYNFASNVLGWDSADAGRMCNREIDLKWTASRAIVASDNVF